MKKNHRLSAILIFGLTLGFGFAISVVSAAPPIKVTSAVPDEAEQGTTNLTVIINGRGFDPLMGVNFCRSETKDSCVPGGVDVKGSVEFISSKQLKVTVDVDIEAVIGNFDIEAISLSSRRRGRGTEKFSVLAQGAGRSETTDCQIKFSVEFTPGNVIVSDGKGAYPDPADSKDKSGGGTSSGPGFRFDTNGKQQIETSRDKRWLEINPVQVPGYSMHMSGADFRFHLPAGGLDLCSLDKDGSGDVPMILAFADDGGTQWALLYDCIFHDTAPIRDSIKGDGSRVKVTVTRNEGDAGGWTKGDTWTITGTDACLISSDNYATSTPVLQAANLSADFEMTIEAQ